MKMIYLVGILIASTLINTFAQTPKLKRIDSLAKRYNIVLRDYTTECTINRYFFEGKGIVKVVVFKDTLNNDCLFLHPLIDDRFKDNPTDSYFFISGGLYLVYKGDSNGHELEEKPNKKLLKALNDLVADRVYIRPKPQKRWAEVPDFNGKIKKVWSKTIFGGADGGVQYIFDKKGNYITLKSV